VVFSDDNKTWYLSCMGPGDDCRDAVADKALKRPGRDALSAWHRIHNGSTHPGDEHGARSDLGDAGEAINASRRAAGRCWPAQGLEQAVAAGDARWRSCFSGREPAVAYVTTCTVARSGPRHGTQRRRVLTSQVHDFATQKAGVPGDLFQQEGGRMYVTTAKPGHVHIFDTTKPASPSCSSRSRPPRARTTSLTKDGATLRAERAAQPAE